MGHSWSQTKPLLAEVLQGAAERDGGGTRSFLAGPLAVEKAPGLLVFVVTGMVLVEEWHLNKTTCDWPHTHLNRLLDPQFLWMAPSAPFSVQYTFPSGYVALS